MVWAPKGLGSPTPMALPDHGHSLCLYSWLLAAFLGRHFMFLATLISGVLHCDFCFTIIASYVVFSGACCKDPALATHCLVSQAFFWNLGGWPSDLIILPFFTCRTSTPWMTPRSVASRSSSQTLLYPGSMQGNSPGGPAWAGPHGTLFLKQNLQRGLYF
jgi:hypothetical protein